MNDDQQDFNENISGAPPSSSSFPGTVPQYQVSEPRVETGEGPTQDEKTWAMLSHVLTLVAGTATCGLGAWIAPLVVYLMRKDQSRFVAFHALQSLYLQFAIVGVAVVFGMGSFVIGMLTGGLGGFLLIPIASLIGLGWLVYIILAGVKAYAGEWFQYAVVGPMALNSVR